MKTDHFFDYESFYNTIKGFTSSVEEINQEYNKYLQTLPSDKVKMLEAINKDNDTFKRFYS